MTSANPYPRGDRRQMTDGEVLARLDSIAADVRGRLDVMQHDVTEIRAQVTATNGRVSSLETDRIRRDAVRAAFSWRVPLTIAVVAGIVASVGAGIILYILTGGAA